MNLRSAIFLLAVIACGVAVQWSGDQQIAFMDHGGVVVIDKPDIPGNVSAPDGSPPTHVTFHDQGEETTRIIYH
uniref:YtkA domain-containing protein n=1 Tax=Caenorhabditis tropicalis TaxID=1561998 RepID=A0A1I7TX12_9PELO